MEMKRPSDFGKKMRRITQLERLLDRWVDNATGEPTTNWKMIPIEPHWNHAFRKARRDGLIRMSRIGFTFGNERATAKSMLWGLTEKGKDEAKRAHLYIAAWRANAVEATRLWNEWRRSLKKEE